MDFFEERKSKLHHGTAGNVCLDYFGINSFAGIHDVYEFRDCHVARLCIDLNLSTRARDQPERRDIGALPVFARRRNIVRLEDAASNNVTGFHSITLLEEAGKPEDWPFGF